MSGNLPHLKLAFSANQGKHIISIIMKMNETVPKNQQIAPPTTSSNQPKIIEVDTPIPNVLQTRTEIAKLKMLEMNFLVSNISLALFQTRAPSNSKEILAVNQKCCFSLLI